MIDVWLASVADPALNPLLDRYAALLNEEEIEQAGRFVREQDRRRYLVSRALLRSTLSRYAAVNVREWRFSRSHLGKPYVDHPDRDVRQLAFSLSHAGDQVALAISRGRRIGLDIEMCLPRQSAMALARHYFMAPEWRSLQASPLAQRDELFTSYWTLKEACVKLEGRGIMTSLSRYGFDLSVDGVIKPLGGRARETFDETERACWLAQWRCADHFLLALSVQAGSSAMPDAQAVNMYRVRPLLDEALEPSTVLRTSLQYAFF